MSSTKRVRKHRALNRMENENTDNDSLEEKNSNNNLLSNTTNSNSNELNRYPELEFDDFAINEKDDKIEFYNSDHSDYSGSESNERAFDKITHLDEADRRVSERDKTVDLHGGQPEFCRTDSVNSIVSEDSTVADLYTIIEKNSVHEFEVGNINEKLRNWSLRHIQHVTHEALNDLLVLLRSEGHFSLPLSAKTLLKTTEATTNVQLMMNSKNLFGEYAYFPIADSLNKIVDPDVFNDTVIELLIHVDGAEFFNKTKKHAWTILGLIHNSDYISKPFLIGIYYGEEKPKSVKEFLNDFIVEINDLISNNIKIKDVIFEVKIAAFVCDTPARAYLKRCKGHTGYDACERCDVHGVTENHKRVYPYIDGKPRTHDDFVNAVDPGHHSKDETSPLLDIANFDVINGVILDPMHLLYSGVSKQLLNLILTSKARCRIQDLEKERLQILVNRISQDIPIEFQRRLFNLDDISIWKATQFRFFLLYSSGLVLREVLTTSVYKHFLLLFTAIRFLSSKEHAVEKSELCRSLLRTFVRLMPTNYGSSSQTINIHNLIHIVDDVQHLKCSLEQYSAFIFESCLGFIKGLLRSTTKPISQISRRVHELRNATATSVKSRYPLTCPLKRRTAVPAVSISNSYDNKIYFNRVELNDMTLTVSHPDNICILKSGKIIQIIAMSIHANNGSPVGDIYLKARKIKVIGDYFDNPVCSRDIGIYVVGDPSARTFAFPLNSVSKKAIYTQVNDTKIVITLLHF